MLLLPLTAVVLYVLLGNQAALIEAHATADPVLTDPKIVAMVERLAERMKTNPEDGNGWALLGRSYMRMGRFNDSAAAFAQAATRLPENAPLLADWADVLAQTQGGRMEGKPTELVNRALQLDPDHLKSLALLGAAAQERGDRPGAIAAYRRMRAQFPPGSEEAKELDGVLADLGAPPDAGAGPKLAASAPAPSTMAAAPAPVPSTSAGAPAAVATASVEGRVDIDAKLKARIEAGDILFVFARNPSGSRMPLAVMRVPAAGEWPRAFALTDAMAMAPGMTISAAKAVVIEARISKGGTAMPQPGDLTGASADVTPGARGVRVLIDRVLP